MESHTSSVHWIKVEKVLVMNKFQKIKFSLEVLRNSEDRLENQVLPEGMRRVLEVVSNFEKLWEWCTTLNRFKLSQLAAKFSGHMLESKRWSENEVPSRNEIERVLKGLEWPEEYPFGKNPIVEKAIMTGYPLIIVKVCWAWTLDHADEVMIDKADFLADLQEWWYYHKSYKGGVGKTLHSFEWSLQKTFEKE